MIQRQEKRNVEPFVTELDLEFGLDYQARNHFVLKASAAKMRTISMRSMECTYAIRDPRGPRVSNHIAPRWEEI